MSLRRMLMVGAAGAALVAGLLIVAIVAEWGAVPIGVLAGLLLLAALAGALVAAKLARRLFRTLNAIQRDARRTRSLESDVAKLVSTHDRQEASRRRRSSAGVGGATMVLAFGDSIDDPALIEFVRGFEFGDVILVTDRSDAIAKYVRSVAVEFVPVPAGSPGSSVRWLTMRLVELADEHDAAVLVEWPDDDDVVLGADALGALSVIGSEHVRPLLRADRAARDRLALVDRVADRAADGVRRSVDQSKQAYTDRLATSTSGLERILERSERRAEKRSETAVRAVRSELDDVYRQVESLSILYRSFDGERSLPHLRGWAVSPDLAVDLVDRIARGGVRTILELGSGASTVLFAMAFESVGEGHVTTLDHEATYADATRAMLEHHGVAHRATVLHTPLVEIDVEGEPYRWYGIDGVDLPTGVDLLFVDGPPESTGPRSRLPAFPLLRDRLADSAAIMLDDGRRPDEQEIAERWAADPGIVEHTQLKHERQPIMLRFERSRAASAVGDGSES